MDISHFTKNELHAEIENSVEIEAAALIKSK